MPPGVGGICYFGGRPVSRVLSGCGSCKRMLPHGPSFILPRHCWRGHTTYPPARASSPQTPVYMVFQPIRCTAPGVTAGTGELLPHLFTIVPTCRDCSFLLHFYTLSDIFPLGRMVLSVARTFLSDTGVGTTDRPAGCKDSQLWLIMV